MTEIEIQKWLVSKVASLVDTHPSKIDITEPFSIYGLTSVDAVGMTADIEDTFKIKVSPTAIWDYPNIASMAAFLAEQGPSK